MKVDILAIGVHPDDVELGAAGTLLKHIAMGHTAAIVDLTQGELGTRGTIESRYEEAENASKLLGLTDRFNLKMQDGFFENNEANKLLLIEQIRRYKPTIVIANAMTDRHPDHGRAGKMIGEACFLAGLRKIETEWEGKAQEVHRPKAVYHYIQDYFTHPDIVVDVSEFKDRKLEVIKAYKTQFHDPNSTEPQTPISGSDFFGFLEGRMREFGRPAGYEFAEGFSVERYPGVDDLLSLD